jgi:phage tail-like protein
MSLQPGDTLVAQNFAIQIDGVQVEYLSGVSGLSETVEVVEYKQVSSQGKPVTKKMPGPVQSGEITVTRGATRSTAFTDWIKNSKQGNSGSARKNVSIVFQDTQMREVLRANLENAWASARSFADFRAGNTDPQEETVTITYETIEFQ